MTVIDVTAAGHRSAVWPLSWQRLLDAELDPVGAPRALLVGGARSGKSAVLQRLRQRFEDDDRDVLLLRGSIGDLADVPPDRVILVDDADLLDRPDCDRLEDRAQDPDAAMIIATRPWRSSTHDGLQSLAQHLRHVVLGACTRSDVQNRLRAEGRTMDDDCIDDILTLTDGVPWLMQEALQRHDPLDCRDGSHAGLERALQECLMHRIDLLPPAVRRAIEKVCVIPDQHAHGAADPGEEDLLLHAHAEGLLPRSGRPTPLVRGAVRTALSPARFADLAGRYAADIARDAATSGGWPILMHDERVSRALTEHADEIAQRHPHHAGVLYARAIGCGADPIALAARRARAAWGARDLECAATIAEHAHPRDAADAASLVDVAAAVWSARGMMTQAHIIYQATPQDSLRRSAHAVIPAIATGSVPAAQASGAGSATSTLDVSLDLLRRGLETSLATTCTESILADLVRATELFTIAGASEPVCELPAVIAAVVALNLGSPTVAQTVLDDAIAAAHGGPWAKPRLLLWRAWVAMQQAKPADAGDALDQALRTGPLSARDALLAHAVRIAIARRYDSAAVLDAAWQRARASVLRTEIDLFLLHPLAEFASCASRVGDAERVEPLMERALQITECLGAPALWTAHLHWANIQQGILMNAPTRLAPHAKALVAASGGNRVAAAMARAGRVWTSVLGGTVDPDAVEAAASALADFGMRWDGARLAGHGAARSDDRRVSARLLACARDLHPTDAARRPSATGDDTAPGDAQTALAEVLSEREVEVAQLVLEGKTYVEIGESIFISPRTVEHHVAHIRQRLDAATRSEMLAKLRVLLTGGDTAAGAQK